MQNHNPILLDFHVHELVGLIYIFLILLILLFTFIFSFTLLQIKRDSNKKSWQQLITQLISEIIFNDDEAVNISAGVERLLQNESFRQCLINEIINTNKSLAGNSINNLKKFYEYQELNKDSAKKLKHHKWHIKAKGIHELAVMGQSGYVKEIFRLTNNTNVLVRNEAQCALINFYEFAGLRFLNVTSYQISDWQQIQLLDKLKAVHPKNLESIKKWLSSDNSSVIVFALKLAWFFKCYEVHNDVVNCLQHDNMHVKLQAIEYLKKIPGENTSEVLVNNYIYDDKFHRLSIINALKNIGSDEQVPFLLHQLNDEDNDIKAASAKSLAEIHPLGASFLQSHSLADQNPWKAIFLQLNNEHAA